jgi:Domain of unknown function (DUF4157)
MNLTSTAQKQTKSAFTPTSTGLLQRKCASCGQHTIAGGECTGCAKKKVGLQRKHTIGASNDPLELEADRVADHVMATPANSTISATSPRIQRFTGQTSGQADMEAPASVDRVLSSPGKPLDSELQQDMGQRFGHDFSRVRVYTGEEAGRSAQDVNANAYTIGQNIVFDEGQFAPSTHEGQRLLAHELAHTIQQEDARKLAMTTDLQVGHRNDPTTRAANSVAHSMLPSRSDRGETETTLVKKTEQTILQRDSDEESKGSNTPERASDEGDKNAPASARMGSSVPCNPKGLLRVDYLKEPHTTTSEFGLTRLNGTVSTPAVHVSKSPIPSATDNAKGH